MPVDETSALSSLKFVLHGYWLKVTAMSLLAFVGGLVEAVFLIVVTRAGFAITQGSGRIGLILGIYTTLRGTMLVALVLVLVRVVFALGDC